MTDLKVVQGGKKALKQGSDRWFEALRQSAKNLIDRINRDYIELGGVLWDIYNTPHRNGLPIFKVWGYQNFQSYAKEELGIHPRRADQLKAVFYRLFVDLEEMDPGLRNRLIGLGFGRVRELARVITLDTATDWIERAEKWSSWQTYQAVVGYLHEQQRLLEQAALRGDEAYDEGLSEEDLFERVASDVERQFPRRFNFYTGQLEIIDAAIERAQQTSGSEVKSHNLYLICLEFLGTHNWTKPSRDQTVQWWVQLEQACAASGLKIVLGDAETNEIVYGVETFCDLAEQVQRELKDDEGEGTA